MAIIFSYALGTVPGAPIVARRHGVDLRQVGDGNPGAWNALDHLGWARAWPAFAIDGLKGLLAAALGWLVLGWVPLGDAAGGALLAGGDGIDGVRAASLFAWVPWDGASAARLDAWLPWACVAAAMLGHAFPLRRAEDGGATVSGGGKAVMTFAGGAVGLVPIIGLPLLAVFVATVLVAAARVRLVALVAIFGFPIAQALATPLVQVAWTGVLMSTMGALFLARAGDRRSRG